MEVCILGAGFSGLAAGIATKAPIYEATSQSGGICRSYNKDGFEFSKGGGHWLFGNVDYVKTLVEVNEYERKAGIYYNTTFPYPFQTVAQEIPILCNGENLARSLFDKFGTEQCNLFFFPFNQKYTAGLMNSIIQADDYKSPPAGGKGFCSKFYDPVGGLNTLVDKMSSQCTINYNNVARQIDTNKKYVTFHDDILGEWRTKHYDKLISTIPLGKLMEMCGQKVNLPHTSVFCLNIGAERGDCTPEEHWLYVPFCKNNFYRVGFYSNVNPDYAPEGKVSIWVEMAVLPKQELDIPRIVWAIVKELQEWRWIGDVLTTDPTWIDCAYTWMYNRESRDSAIKWLKERDIYSIGRYGKWQFQGMTESIQDGLNYCG